MLGLLDIIDTITPHLTGKETVKEINRLIRQEMGRRGAAVVKAKYGVDFHNPAHFKKCMALLNDPEYKYLKRTSYKHDR